jgi:hypothetical protein
MATNSSTGRSLLPLEKQLDEMCELDPYKPGLISDLLEVRSKAFSIWQDQRLKWFTDHKAQTHSLNIISHLGKVLEHLQTTDQRLNVHELYVLLVACYLHDIGMQDFNILTKSGVENYTEEDFEYIRKNHPKRSKELIINRSLRWERGQFDIGLPDDPQYLRPIALVAQAHGSDFFETTIGELRTLPNRPGNLPFRGELLAALLMIGDELDLHEQRATFPEEYKHSPNSLMHHFIHQCVTGVDVIEGNSPNIRKLRLTFEYPTGSEDYYIDVRDSIVRKLQSQMERTNPILEASTKSELTWDVKIEVRESFDPDHTRRSFLSTDAGKIALAQLQLTNTKTQLVDRDELIANIRSKISNTDRKFFAIITSTVDDLDWGQIAKYVKAQCSCLQLELIPISFKSATGHNPSDILEKIVVPIQSAGGTCRNYIKSKALSHFLDETKLKKMLEGVIEDVREFSEHKEIVIILERVDLAENTTKDWILGHLLPDFESANPRILFLITNRNGKLTDQLHLKEVTFFQLAAFTQEEIHSYLGKSMGYPMKKATEKADAIYAYSSGRPEDVYNGLLIEQNQNVNVTVRD